LGEVRVGGAAAVQDAHDGPAAAPGAGTASIPLRALLSTLPFALLFADVELAAGGGGGSGSAGGSAGGEPAKRADETRLGLPRGVPTRWVKTRSGTRTRSSRGARALVSSTATATASATFAASREARLLQDLGVTALWLLPFYPSPQRDDGYDIANYTDVHPDCGTLADFEVFVEQAHRRGLRIITELVLNHTSDQHPWFRRARRVPAGSPERNFYVWSDSMDGVSRRRG